MWSHGIERFKSTLTFNAQAKPSIGGFKLSVYGVTQPIPPGFASGQVAVKQCYERANGRVRKPLGTLDHTLAAEIICAQWADALMNMVYDRMASWEVKMGRRCPYDVPQLRFVRVGLAMEDRPIGTSLSSTSSSSQFSRAVYMLEEFIDASTHGVWRKYINNNSALPLPLPEKLWNDREERTRREFLVFAQHVQYSVTKGLAYVSDFQGGLCNLLSDPQILTNPVLGGNIFGDGNLSSAFENFKDEHDCSKFCWFFKLETLKTVSAVGRSGSVRNSEGSVFCS
ncbi:hypothetical protein LXA43DRAFT_907915 [Ganoderma leucocontextum]|nr:hypothetical protein LXA43DRAFT_907915 [Ganoderma leucocontextum]